MTWLTLNLNFALKCFATTYGVIPFVSYSYCAFVSYSYCYALLIFIEHSDVIYFHQILIKVCNKKQLLNLFHIVLCCIRSSLMLFSFFFFLIPISCKANGATKRKQEKKGREEP